PFTPFPDGRFLLMGPDKELTRQQVAKFSARDAEALPRYEAMLERVADFIEPTLLQTPPNPWSFRPKNLAQLAGLGWRFLKLGKDGPGALEIQRSRMGRAAPVRISRAPGPSFPSGSRVAVPEAREGRPGRARDPDGRGPAHPRPLVRVGAAEDRARDRR